MKAHLISIGDEILIGQIVNTNSVYLAKKLNKIGIEVSEIKSIGDEKEVILESLKQSMDKAELTILTGGLGPTKDDITKHTLCEFFEDKLVRNQEVLEHIEALFKQFIPNPIIEENRKQADLPSKAKIFKNSYGTAAGMWFEKEGKICLSLPGVPYEMKKLMSEEVLPALQEFFVRPFILHKTILTLGKGESTIADEIQDWENQLPETVKLAYLPNFGRVRLRLSSKGFDKNEVEKTIENEIEKLLPLIKEIFIGYEGDSSMEQMLLEKFVESNKTLSLAESCTGGTIASLLTQVPGASSYFKGGVVSYATETKETLLGIPSDLIKKHSVVSKQVAEAMAIEVRDKFSSTIGLATTGNAGPSKGDSEQEIGTVFIAIATQFGVNSVRYSFGKSRERTIKKTTNMAYQLLFRELEFSK